MGARFIRLGIAGFKSFAEATTLEILPGLTGIVGPNGCGKSNVAEALRWVMGEANARHLRGGEMDDIIFSGTASRSSRNLAEVSLTVEDDDQGLPPPFSGQAELQVARRLERGAGSVYRVNGREARARDVQTLFADLASGARSSAMVSQGRVGMLVNARPEERRAVLEEAAGITGLHARRAEAETRLRATETNLERAEERRVLLDRQQEGLRDQARQAARYRTVVEAMLDTEAALLSVQRERASVARDAATKAVATAEAELQRATVASATAVAEAERRHADLPNLRAAESTALAGAERARVALDAIEAELGRARSALAAAQQRHGQLIRDHAHAEATLNDAEAADARLVNGAAQLAIEAAGHPALFAAAHAEANDAAAALLAADQAAGETAAQAAAAGARMAATQQLLQQAEARFRRAEGTVARLAADRAVAAKQLVDADRMQQAAGALQAAVQALDAAKAEQETADHNQVEAAKAARAAREVFNRRDAERHRLAAETQALAEILSVKDGEHWPPMVDSLVVASGLEAALGTALGDDLAAAADPDAARHWRTLPALPASQIPGRRLADSVAGPPSLSRALAGIGLVDTEMEGDAAQAALLPGQCVVSASGALWRWDGYTVRAGTPTTATIRLQQRNRLNRLKQGLAETIATAATALVERDLADRAEIDAVAAAVQRRRQQRDAEQAADRARASVQQLRHQAEAAEARLAAIDAQLAELSPEAALARAAFDLAHQAHSDQPDTALLKRRAEEARTAVASARQRDLAASRNVDRLQRSNHQRQARLSVIDREREDRRMRAADLDGRVIDLRARAKEAAMELDHLAAAPAHIEAGNEAAGVRVAEAEAAGKAARSTREQAEAAAAQATAAARMAEQAGYAAREAIVRAESLQDSAMQAWDTALARIAEREGCLPPLQAPAEISAAAEDRARNRLQRLTRERDEIGPVNLRAETEIAAIEGEIATIMHEHGELGTAVAKLRGSIGHLNREGRERLTEVFQQVDRHFQSLFSRMFGGGRAHLALIGSDDPLQAGLEIYAQPPGKKLSALSLLSGGEQALTALSLIFAVFRCNPAPLCILDEVDAPLDDANVGRFCTLLTDMVQETGTRFLVVTHHQVTMASMDRLYGVTMQERGVSRLLSVDLSRAVGMIEAVAAE